MWRYLAEGMGIDVIKSIIDKGSVVEGVKHIDNPIISIINKAGKYDGNKEGFKEASNEYKKKLLQQADEFHEKRKKF